MKNKAQDNYWRENSKGLKRKPYKKCGKIWKYKEKPFHIKLHFWQLVTRSTAFRKVNEDIKKQLKIEPFPPWPPNHSNISFNSRWWKVLYKRSKTGRILCYWHKIPWYFSTKHQDKQTKKNLNEGPSKFSNLYLEITTLISLPLLLFFFSFPSRLNVIFKHTSSSVLNIGPHLICLWITSPSEESWELQVVPSLSRKLCLRRKSTSIRPVLFMITHLQMTRNHSNCLASSLLHIPKCFTNSFIMTRTSTEYSEEHSDFFGRADRTYQFLH